jgi:Rieske Fe-S protein
MLAACASEDGGDGSEGSTGSGQTKASVPASDVPVGGGTILADKMVVVTQPTEGTFQAFSAVCTHQGCPVQSIADGTINCTCHGSQFSVEDGSVVSGPATSPLETYKASVEGDQVRVS